MKWIGLTGGIASGKSSVANILSAQGLKVVDADEAAHRALSRGEGAYNQVVHLFGPAILNEDNSINRKSLGEIVFGNKDKLEMLESFVHPWVQKYVQERRRELENKGTEFAFYDVPLLFEKSLEPQFDHIIVVACSEQKQIERLKSRNGFTKEEALRRLRSQWPLLDKIKKTPFVIYNDGNLEELKVSVESVLKDLKSKM